MEWYSKCAREAYEQVVAGGSPTTVHLTRPCGYVEPKVRPDVHSGSCNAGGSTSTSARHGDQEHFNIVIIASDCADNLFPATEELNEFGNAYKSKYVRSNALALFDSEATNYFNKAEEERSVLQEWFDSFLIELGEKSSEYRDRGIALAADYNYKLGVYLDAKKTELGIKMKEEVKIAKGLAYQWAQELMVDAKIKAHAAKEMALVSAENYSARAQTYASEKSDELSERLKEDLSYRQEIAKEWAHEFAVVAKEKSIAASHRGYVLAEAFVIFVQRKSMEAVYRGYILAGTCRDNVVVFVEEKGAELAEKLRKEVRNAAIFVEESANQLLIDAKAQVSGKLSIKEFDKDVKRRPTADQRALEKAEELQAEIKRSSQIAQKWAEDLAKEAERLSNKIKEADLVAKSENEWKKAVSSMKDSSAQLSDEAKRKSVEAENQAKEVYEKFQKEMEASAMQAQIWAAELAAAASRQVDITEKRGQELLDKLRKELDLANARKKDFCETANIFVNEKKIEIGEWCENNNCKAKSQAAVDAVKKQLKEAEKQAALLAEDAKQTAAALAKLAMEFSEEAKKKTAQLQERAKSIAERLKATQKQIEILEKELKDLEKNKK